MFKNLNLNKIQRFLTIFITCAVILSPQISAKTIRMDGVNGFQKMVTDDYMSNDNSPCQITRITNSGDLETVASEQCSTGMLHELGSGFLTSMSGETLIETQDGKSIDKISHNPGVSEQIIMASGNFYQNPPIERGSTYAMRSVQNIASKFNLVESVNAQKQDSTVYFPGRGYDILKPVQGLWSVNRNIAYGLLIIIVLYNAFMILLGQKEGGFTPMKTLPNLILALFLITFSYPISGFFIDLLSLGANTVQSILLSTPGSPGYNTIWNGTIKFSEQGIPYILSAQARQDVSEVIDKNVTQPLTGKTDSGYTQYYLEPVAGKYGTQIDDPLVSTWLVFGTSKKALTKEDLQSISLLPNQAYLNTAGPIGGFVSALRNVGGLLGGEVGDVGASLGALILNLVFAITAFMASLKVWFTLLKSYLVLIFYPVLSPYLFLATAIPSMSSRIISDYINTLLGAVLSFIVVYAIYLVILIVTYEPVLDGFNYFIPPLLGYDQNDVVGIGGHLVRMLMAYGLYLITPEAAQKVASLKFDFLSFGNIVSSGVSQTGNTMAMINGWMQSFAKSQFEKKYPS